MAPETSTSELRLAAMLRGAVLLAGAACGWGCQGDADFSDAMPAAVTLNADEYRREITDIDRLVFAQGPFDASRRESLGGRLEELAQRTKASSDSRFIAIEVLEVRRLAEVAKRAPANPPPQMLSNQWMRIRANVFDDRSWFARSAADLEEVPACEPSPMPVAAGKPASEAVAAATPGPSANVSAAPSGLNGRWRVKELYGDGKPTHDKDLSGSLWVFAGEELAMSSPAGTAVRYAVTPIHDSRGSALLLRAREPVEGRLETGWLIYEIAGETLTVAFHDGLGERPAGFEPTPGRREPMLVKAVLVREDGAEGTPPR
jgi:uncharacterized protein (TIGR03067 family)